ncbi:hypothetical protein QEJ31_10935 [Pigmentibacter sp. JX0631]|uniref:hypothetical protein n=1 Tax=Pigmentibacter sp. JX0631 TaxID=2976982 RepID=UPI00246918FF|nr:hypothetical protein [Pigmentibacter sp. JX0631]WGL59033.1 hypothetical protein QEJ31_10935 [Pigmentibacter sp. JX0631]
MKLLKIIFISLAANVAMPTYAEEQDIIYQLNQLEDDVYRLQSEYVTASDLLYKDRKKQNTRSMEIEDLKDKIRILHFKYKNLEKKLQELEAKNN